eukprot:4653551-Prymnesium_polylepis.2
MYPGEPWSGPDPARLSLGRLAGGGALMADTCNTAQKVQDLLQGMIAEQAQVRATLKHTPLGPIDDGVGCAPLPRARSCLDGPAAAPEIGPSPATPPPPSPGHHSQPTRATTHHRS